MSDDEGRDEVRDGDADDETPPPPAVTKLRMPPQKATLPRPPSRPSPSTASASSLSNLARNGVPPTARVRAPLLATTTAAAASSSCSPSASTSSLLAASSVRTSPNAPPPKVAPIVPRVLPRVGATKSTAPVPRSTVPSSSSSPANISAAARPPISRAPPASTSVSSKRGRDPEPSGDNTQEPTDTLAPVAADDGESRGEPEPDAEQDDAVPPSSKRARLATVPRAAAAAGNDAKQKAPPAKKVAPKLEARSADRDADEDDDDVNGSLAATADGGTKNGVHNVALGDEKRGGGGKSGGSGDGINGSEVKRAPPSKIGNVSANRAAVGVALGVGKTPRKQVDENGGRGPMLRTPPTEHTADGDDDGEKDEADTKAEVEGIVKKEPEDESDGADETASAESKNSNWTGGLANSKQEVAEAPGGEVREKRDGDGGDTMIIGDSVGGGAGGADGDGGADEDDYAEFATWHGAVFKKMCALVVAVGVIEAHMTFSPHGLTVEATPPTTGAVLQLRWRRRFWKSAPFQCSRFPFMVGQPFKEMLKLVTIANGDSLDLVYKTNSGVVLYRPQTPSEQTKKNRQQQQKKQRAAGGQSGDGQSGDDQGGGDGDGEDEHDSGGGGGSRQAFEARIVRNIEISGVKLAVPNAKIPSRSLKYRARLTMPHARAAGLMRALRQSTNTDLVIEMTPEFMSWTVGNSYGLSSFEFVSGVSQHLGEDVDDAELEQMANADGGAEGEEIKAADDVEEEGEGGDDERPKRGGGGGGGGGAKRKTARGGNEADEEDDDEQGSAPSRGRKRARHDADEGGGGGGRDRRGRGGGGGDHGDSSDEEDLETLVARENAKTRQAAATRTKRKTTVVQAAQQPKKKPKTEATIRYQSKSSFAQKLTIKELAKFILQPKITEFVTMSFHPMLPCRIEYKDDELDISVRYYLGHQEKTDDEL